MAAVKAALIGLLAVTSVLGITRGDLLSGKQPSLEIIADKFDTCPQYPHLNNTITNLTMWNPPDEDVLYISGTLVLRVTLYDSPDFKYVTKLKRCFRQDWSSCEKYVEFQVGKMCEKLAKEDSSWAGTVKKLEGFDPHCPISQGNFNFEDAPIDISDIRKVPAAEGNWQIEMRTTFKDDVIFCVVGNAKIKRKQPNMRGKEGGRG